MTDYNGDTNTGSGGALATVTPRGDTSLAAVRNDVYALASIDSVFAPLDTDAVDLLPAILLQATTISTVGWAITAKVLKDIRDTGVWETVDDGKYAGDWDAFLGDYTKGQEFSAKKASNLLGYANWLATNKSAIDAAKPEDYDGKSQVPRETTMRFIAIYHEAFENSPKLLRMAFYDEVCNHDILRAEVRDAMGAAYIASREPPQNRAKNLGGQMQRPTFGPFGVGTHSEKLDPRTEAFVMLLERVGGMMTDGVYGMLNPDQQVIADDKLEQIVATVLNQKGEL
jgi:hypothetical protein